MAEVAVFLVNAQTQWGLCLHSTSRLVQFVRGFDFAAADGELASWTARTYAWRALAATQMYCFPIAADGCRDGYVRAGRSERNGRSEKGGERIKRLRRCVKNAQSGPVFISEIAIKVAWVANVRICIMFRLNILLLLHVNAYSYYRLCVRARINALLNCHVDLARWICI